MNLLKILKIRLFACKIALFCNKFDCFDERITSNKKNCTEIKQPPKKHLLNNDDEKTQSCNV